MSSDKHFNSAENPRNAHANLLTPEEVRIMKGLRKEATLYRAVPFATVSGGIIYILGRNGRISRSNLGLKVIMSGFAGFCLGLMSYTKIIRDRILSEAPHGTVAQRLRRDLNMQSFHDQFADKSYTHQNSSESLMLESEGSSHRGTIWDSSDHREIPNTGPSRSSEVRMTQEPVYERLRREHHEEFRKKLEQRTIDENNQQTKKSSSSKDFSEEKSITTAKSSKTFNDNAKKKSTVRFNVYGDPIE